MPRIAGMDGTGTTPAMTLALGSAPYLWQARRVAAPDHVPVGTLEPADAPDQPERILFAHVVGIVGAEQHVPRPVLADHMAQHLRIEGDGVEIHFRKVVGGRPLDHGAAVGPCAVAMVHARPV